MGYGVPVNAIRGFLSDPVVLDSEPNRHSFFPFFRSTF